VVEEIERVARCGDPIRTWGGRLYFPERPGADGRSKIYKLINYLVQGSSADVTKQAIIDWSKARNIHDRFLVTVYDEINICAPSGAYADDSMQRLKEVMEAPRFTVPMRTSGKRGVTWGDAVKCP
jgi:DNA polymerase I-like protein with 3'-5' exonuclease and polymerase domains